MNSCYERSHGHARLDSPRNDSRRGDPSHAGAQRRPARRRSSRKAGDVTANVLAYCDARGQPTIVLTNVGPAPLVVEWTLTAFKPGYPPDTWSNVSLVEPGQFQGWMSPAPYLHLDYRYDDEGREVADRVLAYCPATAGWFSGPGE